MSVLIESYEQQYSVLVAEITSRIGRLKLTGNDKNSQLISELRSNFEEAQDLLEQLELEVRGSGQQQLLSRVACYKVELERIKKEFTSSRYQDGDDEVYDDWNSVAEQKQKLLENSERIERTGNKLTDTYRVILETEQIGAAVLEDLSMQRETIERARGRLHETDEDLSKSSRLLNNMIVRSMQEKFALYIFFMIFGIVLFTSLYFYIK